MEVGEVDEAAVDEEEQHAVEQGEAEVHEQTRGEGFDVDLEADAGGGVADDGLGNAIDAEVLRGESILEEADDGAGERSCDGRATRDGEENEDDEGKIENREARKRFRQQRLQK